MILNLFKRKKKPNDENQFEENEESFDNSSKKSKSKKLIIALVSISLAVILVFCTYLLTLFAVKKDYEYVASLTNLPEPLQIEHTNTITTQVDDYLVTYNIKATYTLIGLVVEKYYYLPYSLTNKIGRYDFGMAWGPLLNKEISDKIKFRNDGQRFLHYQYPNSLISEAGSREAIINSISNNHLIHSNNKVLKLFRNVKEGDYIKLEGYLVDVFYKNDYEYGTWPTSLSRTDHGDGACEVFYVTNVTWLKQK